MYTALYIYIYVYRAERATVSLSKKVFLRGRCIALACQKEIQGGEDSHGVATISRLLKIIGLFCKRAL